MQATGFLLDIPRVEVLINSSRLSSKLKLDVKLLPIKAVLASTPGTERPSGSQAVMLQPLPFTCCRRFLLSQTAHVVQLLQSHGTEIEVQVLPVVVELRPVGCWSCNTSRHQLCCKSPSTPCTAAAYPFPVLRLPTCLLCEPVS